MCFSKRLNKVSESQMTVEPKKSQLSVSDCCIRGQKLLDGGKDLMALEYFQAAVELEKDNIVALRGMMDVYEKMGKIDKATEISKKLEKLYSKNPDINTEGLSLDVQLENEMRRYMNLIYTMLIVETDEFGLRLGRFTVGDEAVLLGCENGIHKLEKSLGKKETDFNKIRDSVFDQYCSKYDQIKAVINKLYGQYSKTCKESLVKENGVYSFSTESLKELRGIEESIIKMNTYMHRQTDMHTFLVRRNIALMGQLFIEYANICNDNVVEVNGVYGFADDAIIRLKEIEKAIIHLDPNINQVGKFSKLRDNAIRVYLQQLYKKMTVSNLIKTKIEGRITYVVSEDASVRERLLRSQIVALMGEQGNDWCNNEIKAAEKQYRRKRKRKHLIIGVLIGLAVVVPLFVFFTNTMLIIVLELVLIPLAVFCFLLMLTNK